MDGSWIYTCNHFNSLGSEIPSDQELHVPTLLGAQSNLFFTYYFVYNIFKLQK